MRPRGAVLVIGAFALLVSACTASGGGDGSSGAPSAIDTASGASHAPVTLNVWSFYTGHEFDQYAEVLKDFTNQYPWITVDHTPGKSDQDILRAINSDQSPDIGISAGPDNVAKFCDSDSYQDLNPFLKQDGMVASEIIPEQALRYTSYQGDQCTLPVLSDAYGLYYNTDMFRSANITKPPTTLSELEADAKKLTTFKSDGSIDVAGFMPLSGFYENAALYNGVYSNGKWYDADGKSAFASDPTWASLLDWQKQFITDVYGQDGFQKLTDFFAELGGPNSEWSSANGFESGRIAMLMDGEWRTAFIKSDGVKVNYATAPFPAMDDQPQQFGAGQIGGDVFGMPSGAAHPAEAWLLIKYLATDTAANTKLAEVLGNVPTTFDALKDPVLNKDPHFRTFMKIFADPKSAFKPLTVIGQGDSDLWGTFLENWESGKVTDLQQGLQSVSQNIDQQFQLG